MISLIRYSKSIVLLAIFLLAIFVPAKETLAGTTGKIRGVVLDAGTNEALIGVNVVIVGTTMGASTDSDGIFFILNLPPGNYAVRATMIGYGPVVQQNVRVSADRTTNVDFNLSQAVLDVGEEVVITASRPLVETDVSSSQIVTTSDEAARLPASQIIETIALEPGVELDNMEEIRIRGGGSDQISFQVDGMERMDRLNTKAYISMNSASISEVQILTGGFNAEYGNVRSGIFNVITKEGSKIVSGTIDYRFSPAHQKHFGPGMYSNDQYDYQLYGTSAAMNEVKNIEGDVIWQGWNSQTESLNNSNYLGKNDWTPAEIQQVWDWRHRGTDYTNQGDHYLDAGVGGPLKFLESLGLKEAGYFAGYKYSRFNPIFPMLSETYDSDVKEMKVSFKPHSSIKVVLNGLYGKTSTTTSGNSWNPSGLVMQTYHEQSDATAVNTATGKNKYYLSTDCLLDVWTKQIGAKITHTLSPSTFYEIKYNRFWTDSKSGRGSTRSPLKYQIKEIGGVNFDEAPFGWVDESQKQPDLTGTYDFGGGGRVKDTSSVVTQKFNIDLVSQINHQNMVKVGFEFEISDLKRDYGRIEEVQLLYGEWVAFEESPMRFAGYIQDKLEYGGMIANIGLRIDHFASNGVIYEPDNIYSAFFKRGGTEGMTSFDDIPQEDAESYTYISPRIGFSHPVRQNTKFFFNYGVFYSEPQSSYRYGLYAEHRDFGDPMADIRWTGYANLKSPRTAMYEVGFEQSILDQYTVRASFYSKDNEDQISNIRIDGMAGSHSTGDFLNAVINGGAAGYNTPRNNVYQDIRGIELKVHKLRGRYFTGFLNFDYQISVSGNYGEQRLNQDPLVGYYVFSAVQERPEPQPKFVGNLDFHTPNDWGPLAGNWRASIIQNWIKGKRVIWNPEGLPNSDVTTKYNWVNYYTTSLRLTKSLDLSGTRLDFYMDVTNLFNFKYLNWNALSSSEKTTYINQVVDGTNGLGNDIGDNKDKNGNDVFIENWVDNTGTDRAPIAPSKDFALFLNPRALLFGVKLDF